MRKLKKKYQKDEPTFVFTKIEKRKGRWCEYYEDRLPYPIECQSNHIVPLCVQRPNCLKCTRSVNWQAWKEGKWDRIKYAISQGEDLTGMEPPNQTEEGE